MTVKILAVAGTSGGHIFPALGFLDALKSKLGDARIMLVLPKKKIPYDPRPYGFAVRFISVTPLCLRFSLQGLHFFLNFIRGCLESLWILLTFKPDIVIGFGSLASIPLVSLAWFFRISTLIHEQNVFPGQANRLLARFADLTAVSFSETKKFLTPVKKKIVLTGNPLRKQISRIEKGASLDYFSLQQNRMTLLVMGGSQGSSKINSILPETLSGLRQRDILQVIHLAGPQDAAGLCAEYERLGVSAKVFAFLEEMQYAYSASDLAISRAGAGAISEMVFYQLPAIIIPYPYAHQHQEQNAKVLADKGAAVVLTEDECLDGNRLKAVLEPLLSDPLVLRRMRESYSGISAPNANELLSQQVISLVKYRID